MYNNLGRTLDRRRCYEATVKMIVKAQAQSGNTKDILDLDERMVSRLAGFVAQSEWLKRQQENNDGVSQEEFSRVFVAKVMDYWRARLAEKQLSEAELLRQQQETDARRIYRREGRFR